jgi:fumarylpyruvate hydrolase
MDNKLNRRRTFLRGSLASLGTVALAGNAIGHAQAAQHETFVVPAQAITTLAVEGNSGSFPVRRIYCLGRNYRAHVEEMGGDASVKKPLFFMKPRDAIVAGGGDFPYPPRSENVHYEVELVIAVGRGGSNIAEVDALQYVYGYAVGIDMTRRDLQGVASKAGGPWEIGKSFDYSAPCSAIKPASAIGHPDKARIWLRVNNEIRQDSDISRLIWDSAKGISILSSYYRLETGDLIFTGTPAGVGQITRGDVVQAGVEGIGEVRVTVT